MKKQLLMFLLMSFSITICHAYSDSLVMVDFKIDKTQYLPGQTIWVETQVQNISNKPLLIAYNQSKEVTVFNSDGEKAQNIFPSIPTVSVLVLPESIINIGPSNMVMHHYYGNKYLFTNYPLGHYSVRCSIDFYYQGDLYEIKDAGVKQKIVSTDKPIESVIGNICFDIVEQSENEKVVMRAIESYNEKLNNNPNSDMSKVIKQIVTKYPKSAYAPQCLSEYIDASRRINKYDLKAVKQFFNNYSDSKYIYRVSQSLLDHYNGLSLNYLQVKRELNKWKEQYKTNENVVKVIDKLLAKIKGHWRYN